VVSGSSQGRIRNLMCVSVMDLGFGISVDEIWYCGVEFVGRNGSEVRGVRDDSAACEKESGFQKGNGCQREFTKLASRSCHVECDDDDSAWSASGS
jgi:hypothetical protein